MAAIGRFQKGDDIFYAKVVDGELYRLKGDVFGSPSFEKKPTKLKGLRTLTPVAPTKVIAVGLNYADHARESGKPLPKEPLFWLKAPTSFSVRAASAGRAQSFLMIQQNSAAFHDSAHLWTKLVVILWALFSIWPLAPSVLTKDGSVPNASSCLAAFDCWSRRDAAAMH